MGNICRVLGLNLNEIMPMTFIIDFDSPNIKNTMNEFIKYYINNHPNNIKKRLKGYFSIEQLNFNLKIKYKEIIAEIN